jgi:hypothetical protein
MSRALRDRALSRGIADRIRFLRKVVDFVESIAKELGCSHISENHTIYELHNFGDFSFYVDTGQSDGRGKMIKVWYHSIGGYQNNLIPVLDMYLHQSEIKDGVLNKFDHLREWQDELLWVVRCRKSATARFRRKTMTIPSKGRKMPSQRRFQLEDIAMRLKVLI